MAFPYEHASSCAKLAGGDEEAAEVCGLALQPPPVTAEGPSPSTSSQVSSALAHHTLHGQQQNHPHHHPHHPHHGRHGHGAAKDHGRASGQVHQPSGPPGTSAGPYWTGGGGGGGGAPTAVPATGGLGFSGFSAAPGSVGQWLPSFGTGPSNGGGSLLFQTPVTGQGGAFASPSFGGSGGFGFGFGLAPVGSLPASVQQHPSDADGDGHHTGGMQPFRFMGMVGGGVGGGIFATPSPMGLGGQPPAPPQKQPQYGQSQLDGG